MEGSGVVGGVKKENLKHSSIERIKVVTVLDTAVSTDCLTMASRAANELDVDTLEVVTVDTELMTVVALLEAVVEAALLPTGVDDRTKELGLEMDRPCSRPGRHGWRRSRADRWIFRFATFLATATSKLL